MSRFLKAFWKMLRSNLSLKIMALLFAIILWSYVLAATNPLRERVLQDITVRYQNSEDLKAKDLAISGSLSDVLNSVDIRIKVNQNDLKFLNDQNAQAYVDLSTINGAGKHTIKITAQTTFGQVLEVSPSEVTLYVDGLVSRTVPVNIDTIGSVPEGYYAGAPETAPNVVSITGARTDVERVQSALCNIDLNGVTEKVNKSFDVTLLDSNGETVPSTLFTGSLPSVIVNLSVLPEKTVAVDVSGSVIGQDSLAPGYEITDITCIPKMVNIIGEKSVLDGVLTIPLVPFSVSGASADIVTSLDYAPPTGVTVLNTGKAEVTVSIREIKSEKKYSAVAVQLKNVPAGLNVTLDPSSVDVTVAAGASKLSNLSKSQVVPYVDMDGLTPGVYNLKVLFEVPSGFSAQNFTASIATVAVTIK